MIFRSSHTVFLSRRSPMIEEITFKYSIVLIRMSSHEDLNVGLGYMVYIRQTYTLIKKRRMFGRMQTKNLKYTDSSENLY